MACNLTEKYFGPTTGRKEKKKVFIRTWNRVNQESFLPVNLEKRKKALVLAVLTHKELSKLEYYITIIPTQIEKEWQ